MKPAKYHTHKAINRSVEFRGLAGPYIILIVAGIIALLILFAILHMAGCSLYICAAVDVSGGAGLITGTYYLNKRYGRHGFQKKRQAAAFPKSIILRSRNRFMK